MAGTALLNAILANSSELVQQLLEDEALRQELADHALAFAADYSVEQFARDMREIYALTLARSASR